MPTTPEETTKTGAQARTRYPTQVMTTLSDREAEGEVLIPWNAHTDAIIEGLDHVYYNFQYLTGFYTLDTGPRSPLVLTFGFSATPAAPPAPDDPILVLRRGILRDEIRDTITANRQWPYLIGRWIDHDTATLTFDAVPGGTECTAGGEGTPR